MFKKYDAYKDSGVEWIGEIPSDWSIEKAKWIFSRAERPVRKEDEIVTCFRDGEVTLRSNRRTEGFTNALKEHGYQGIRKGDLVIHAMDAFAGAIGVSDSDGKSTPVYSACIPRIKNRINVYYYSYYLRNLALAGFIESLAKGIRERSTDFRFSDFSELLLPFPALEDQNQIVEFLDQKTSEIDQAIAIKEQQIALLNERKQIVIQKAVTQGLNPNVVMKDSGVEWIGNIPTHWEIKKTKYASFINQNTLPETYDRKSLISYVDIGNVSFEKGIKDVQTFRFGDAPSRARRLAKCGDTVVSTVRTYLKAITYVDENSRDYVYSTGFAILSPRKDIYPKFLASFIKSHAFTHQVDIVAKGMSYPAINSTELSNLWIVLPPYNEQKELANFLDKQITQLDQIIDHKKIEIHKLEEYKTTLINDAVTGKIKVV